VAQDGRKDSVIHMSRSLALVSLLLLLASCTQATEPREILFVREVGDSLQLWWMSEDGSGARPFTNDPQVGPYSNLPDRSPDGTRVLFSSGPSPSSLGIYVANKDGTDVLRIDPGDFQVNQWPAWSPDGTEIVFNGGPSAVEQDLFLMKADGSGVRRLTAGESMDYCPRWSPDGQKLVFSSVVADTFRLMTWDRTEGTVSELLPRGFEAECGDWSPDGSRIAFSSTPDHDYPSLEGMASWTPRMSIYVLDVATRAITQLTDLAGTSARPRWSPDGHQILFHSTESIGTVPFSQLGTAYELYVIEADGSDIRRLTRNDMYDAHPAWQGR
jgi:TolB protein